MIKAKIKTYFSNGGMKDVIGIAIQLIIYLMILGFFAGRFSSENDQLQARVCEMEKKQTYFEEIKVRLTALEQNQQRILEILQGKYK